jgi:hypothetical protein
MVTGRIDIRIDEDRKRKLEEIMIRRGLSRSSAIRQAIDHLYEEDLSAGRRAAVEAIAKMEIEDLPEPEELSRQLASTYDSPLP